MARVVARGGWRRRAPTADPVITVNTVFESTLKSILDTEIDRIRKNLGDGGAVTSMTDYKHLTGQIFAYSKVLNDYCPEANTIVNKR